MKTNPFQPQPGSSRILARLLLGRAREQDLIEHGPPLRPPALFREELERETMRADRTETSLTLLLFTPVLSTLSAAQRVEQLTHLAVIVEATARKSDCKGYFSDRRGLHVAVLLYHTPPQRATRLMESVCQEFASLMRSRGDETPWRLRCEIFAYPYPTASGSGDGAQRAELAEQELGEGDAPGDADGAGSGEAWTIAPVQPLQRLLARPLPVWKRSLDLAVAVMALVLLSPVWLLIALLVWLTSPGPVFYKQERVGFLGQPFVFWKFRTMRENADSSAHQQYLAGLIENAESDGGHGGERPMRKLDPVNRQITPLGRILRASSLDELPQIINVLRGEMSLVGPRPCLPYEAERYRRWHTRRFDMVPGITGLWQVMGKNHTTFKQMIRYDINYARTFSLGLDLKILLLTIPTIIRDFRELNLGGRALRKGDYVNHA